MVQRYLTIFSGSIQTARTLYLLLEGHAKTVGDRSYCHIRKRACQAACAACAAGKRAFIAEQQLRWRPSGTTCREHISLINNAIIILH